MRDRGIRLLCVAWLIAVTNACSAPCLPVLSNAVLPTGAARELAAAEERLAKGDYPAARDAFRALLASFPDHFATLRGEQESLVRLGRAAEAREIADRRVARLGDANAYLLLARIAAGEEAESALARARELEPDHPYGRLATGMGFAGHGDLAAAEEEFTAALEACAPPPEALLCRARVRAGLGRYDDAALDYREYVALRPSDLAARHEYASLLQRELGRRDEALDQYRAMLAIDKDSPEAIIGSAVIASLRGDTEGAERLYLGVVHREPTAWLNLGLLYRDDLGRKRDALDCFRRFLAFEGERAENRSATDRLFVVPGYVEELERELGESAK